MLIAENITKKFSGVVALQNVNLEFHKGKVNAIIGENGAGKSTLMKILSGVYQDYEGRIIYKGNTVTFSNPREARDSGIAIIHQELSLIPWLTITENIFLGRELCTKLGMLNKQAMRLKTSALLQKLRLDLSPDTKVAKLKVGQQQVVEIAKALLVDSDVIIMDEPTSAISESEVEILFETIDNLRKENKAIVYISHKLNELFRIADRYLVLRDGRSIESGDMKGMTHDSIINKMVGRDIKITKKEQPCDHKKVVLSVENVCLRHPVIFQNQLLKNISFKVHAGEILGIFGLMGAGRTELLETIFGMYPKRASGDVKIDGKPVDLKAPSHAIKAGLALVPEDRKKDGLVLGLDVRSNMSLTMLGRLERNGFIEEKEEQALVKKYIGELQIKTAGDRVAVKNLSGGNQQKIVLAKWLAMHPKIIMLDEPTRGIDINAKSEIYKLILGLSALGLGVIVVSSELPEIISLSDRILVMCEGEITAELPIGEATEDVILKAAIGSHGNS